MTAPDLATRQAMEIQKLAEAVVREHLADYAEGDDYGSNPMLDISAWQLTRILEGVVQAALTRHQAERETLRAQIEALPIHRCSTDLYNEYPRFVKLSDVLDLLAKGDQ